MYCLHVRLEIMTSPTPNIVAADSFGSPLELGGGREAYDERIAKFAAHMTLGATIALDNGYYAVPHSSLDLANELNLLPSEVFTAGFSDRTYVYSTIIHDSNHLPALAHIVRCVELAHLLQEAAEHAIHTSTRNLFARHTHDLILGTRDRYLQRTTEAARMYRHQIDQLHMLLPANHRFSPFGHQEGPNFQRVDRTEAMSRHIWG